MAAPQIQIEPLWLALWAPALFLIATNPVTNGYTHNLHNDALSQLVTLAAFYLLLRYAEAPSRGVLVLMAVLPAAGFLIKQSLVVWAGFFAAYLLVFDKPLSVRRVLVFSASAAALTGLLLALCLAVWGYPFYYWVLFVLGKHGVSPLRSFQHLLDIWPFLVAGLFGGLVLFRREPMAGVACSHSPADMDKWHRLDAEPHWAGMPDSRSLVPRGAGRALGELSTGGCAGTGARGEHGSAVIRGNGSGAHPVARHSG
jgi:hypothetical protein